VKSRGTGAPHWIPLHTVLAIHNAQLARFGGMPGIRTVGLVESAVVRPQQIHHYQPDSSMARLAAAYAFGLTRNHGFIDGNKRTAFLTALVFLERNGWELEAPEPEVVLTMLGVAAGEITEEQLTGWMGRSIRRL
jgi:death on curing protein